MSELILGVCDVTLIDELRGILKENEANEEREAEEEAFAVDHPSAGRDDDAAVPPDPVPPVPGFHELSEEAFHDALKIHDLGGWRWVNKERPKQRAGRVHYIHRNLKATCQLHGTGCSLYVSVEVGQDRFATRELIMWLDSAVRSNLSVEQHMESARHIKVNKFGMRAR